MRCGIGAHPRPSPKGAGERGRMGRNTVAANGTKKDERFNLTNTDNMGIITLNPLAPGAGDQQNVKPILKNWAQLRDARDAGNLIPGQYYRITDYVTTVNGATITNARSAGHPLDILVRADSVSTLNEQAWAVRHEGDTYFKDARLEAWELKYRLDNVQWSKQAGTYVTDEDNGYTFQVIGDITLSGHTYKLLQGFGMYVKDWSDYALMDTVAEGEQIICYYGDPEDFDPEEPEVVGTASGVEEVTEAGKGTITWMKDEHGNECPYDFKNVQFKRWKVTDELERENINGHYIGILNNLSDDKQSIEDEEDFIWCYTFAMPIDGSQDTSDFSLRGDRCFNNRFFPRYEAGSPVLYDNVMLAFSEDSDFYSNTFSGSYLRNNTFSGNDINNNTFSGNNISYNTFSGNNTYNNTFSGNGINNNTFSGSYLQNNTFSGNFITYNTFSGNNIHHNTFSGNYINNNTFSGNDINYNTFSGSYLRNNTFSGNNISYNTFSGNTQYCIFGFPANNCTFKAQNTSQYMQCVDTCGQLESQTVSVPGNSKVAIYVGMNSNNQLKIWKPADLVQ